MISGWNSNFSDIPTRRKALRMNVSLQLNLYSRLYILRLALYQRYRSFGKNEIVTEKEYSKYLTSTTFHPLLRLTICKQLVSLYFHN